MLLRLLPVLSAVLMSCASCSPKPQTPDAPPVGAKARWTVLVFMNGDNELDSYAVEDFLEMARVGSSPDLNIVVQLDRIGMVIEDLPTWSHTLRFRVTKDMKPMPCASCMDLKEVNMGTPEALEDFVSWGIKTYPAERYALIIWDHGQGYRNFMLEPPRESAGAPRRGTWPPKASALAVIHRSGNAAPHRSVSHDYTDGDELYNAEVASALKSALGDRKLDVLGFDACLMSMVETAYAFRSFAHVMVGSEDLEPASGWQYDDWLARLKGDLSMDGRKLGRVLVESYQQRYGNPPDNLDDDPTTTLSAVELGNMDAVAKAVSALAVAMQEALPTELKAIQAARGQCANFAPNTLGYERDEFFHVDFIHFCKRLLETQASPRLKAAASAALQLTDEAVIESYAGRARKEDGFGTSGLAIYFPPRMADYRRDLYVQKGYEKDNEHFPVAFVRDQQWADFIHAYLGVVP